MRSLRNILLDHDVCVKMRPKFEAVVVGQMVDCRIRCALFFLFFIYFLKELFVLQ